MSKFILLTDDDTDDRLLFTEALREVCLESRLELAFSCCTALAKLAKMKDNLPDVIVLDLNMPGVNGLDCLKVIREDSRFRHIPVLILTTSDSQEIIDESYKRGATFFAKKPSSFEKLQEIIARILGFEWSRLHVQPDRRRFVEMFEV